ncbi:hypothetical protein ACVI1J_006153 [Bradyrhizobium diazoefficiens]|jgi:hypothetical protein|nr:hypothetical protein [Bradyrhizobium sp. CCBAU 21362]MBP1096112.1 hypothetical protein [Bradyrhizobium japonicum]
MYLLTACEFEKMTIGEIYQSGCFNTPCAFIIGPPWQESARA